MKLLVLNGPNLNLLGVREPGLYGTVDYQGLLELIQKKCDERGVEVRFYQSNHEGDLVDAIQEAASTATASSSTRAPTPTPAWPSWTR